MKRYLLVALVAVLACEKASAAGSTSEVFVATACLVPGAVNAEPVTTPVPVPFVLPSVYEGVLSAVNSNSVIDFFAAWTPNEFGARPFCAELESGESIRILTNDLNTLVLERVPVPLPRLGSRFRVRPLLTVDDVFSQALAPGNTLDTADNVLLFDASAQQTQTAFISTDSSAPGWRDQNGAACADAILPAQCAVLVRRRSPGDNVIVCNGVIARGAVRITVFPGLNWIAAPPLGTPLTLSDLHIYTGKATTGLAAGPTPEAADTLMVFSGVTGPTTYFYSSASNAKGWRDLSMTASSATTLPAGTAILVERKAPRESFAWRVVAGR